MSRNFFNAKNLVINGEIDFGGLAEFQRIQNREGSNISKRYENLWEDMGRAYQNFYADQEKADFISEYDVSDEEVWVVLKFADEEGYYPLKDLNGNSIGNEEYIHLKNNIEKYYQFELECWSRFIEKSITTKDELYVEVADLLNMPMSKIKEVKVDTVYDKDREDVVISFHARIELGF